MRNEELKQAEFKLNVAEKTNEVVKSMNEKTQAKYDDLNNQIRTHQKTISQLKHKILEIEKGNTEVLNAMQQKYDDDIAEKNQMIKQIYLDVKAEVQIKDVIIKTMNKKLNAADIQVKKMFKMVNYPKLVEELKRKGQTLYGISRNSTSPQNEEKITSLNLRPMKQSNTSPPSPEMNYLHKQKYDNESIQTDLSPSQPYQPHSIVYQTMKNQNENVYGRNSHIHKTDLFQNVSLNTCKPQRPSNLKNSRSQADLTTVSMSMNPTQTHNDSRQKMVVQNSNLFESYGNMVSGASSSSGANHHHHHQHHQVTRNFLKQNMHSADMVDNHVQRDNKKNYNYSKPGTQLATIQQDDLSKLKMTHTVLPQAQYRFDRQMGRPLTRVGSVGKIQVNPQKHQKRRVQSAARLKTTKQMIQSSNL